MDFFGIFITLILSIFQRFSFLMNRRKGRSIQVGKRQAKKRSGQAS